MCSLRCFYSITTIFTMIPFEFFFNYRGIAEVPENVSDNGSVAEVTGEVLPQIQDEMASPVLGQVILFDLVKHFQTIYCFHSVVNYA